VTAGKTKQELLEEIKRLRSRIAELEKVAGSCELAMLALRESEEELRLVTETIEDVFWIATPGLKEKLYVSPAYEKIWGRSKESLYEDPFSFIQSIHPDDRRRVREWTQHHEEEIEYRILRPDGSTRWIRDRGFPVYDTHGKVTKFVGVATDITDVKEKVIALKQAEKLTALEHMVAFVAHEMRNPLQVMLSGVETMENGLREDPEKLQILQELRYGIDTLGDAISYLMDYALPIHLDCSWVSVRAVVDNALAQVAPRLKNISIEKRMGDDTQKIYADREKFSKVLAHLLTNSIEAMPEGGVIRIRSRFSKNGEDRVRITIADTGRGIRPEDLERVMEPFFTTKPEGTGLGLSVSSKIIQAHKGTLTITSEIDKGATVKIVLPAGQK
jgi:PAS domain S-box-containing protein